LPSKGLTNYLSKGTNENIHDYIVKLQGFDNLSVLPSGAIPPNPVDLLMNSKIDALFDDLKKEYDYIVVDTAPVSLGNRHLAGGQKCRRLCLCLARQLSRQAIPEKH
jgi:Mrp family chromosome partitioning ATPase